MWHILFFNLLLINAAFCTDTFCKEDVSELCDRNDLPLLHFPHDIDDFQNLCRAYVGYTYCLETYEKLCPDGPNIMFFSPGDSETNYKWIREICDCTTTLHDNFLKSMTCFELTLNSLNSHLNACKSASVSKNGEYREFIRDKIEENDIDLEIAYNDYLIYTGCIHLSYSVVCILSKIGDTCGSLPLLVVAEIVQRSELLHSLCMQKDIRNLGKGFLRFLGHTYEALILEAVLK